MPTVGTRCHELRVDDADHRRRVIYRVDVDSVLVVDVFVKRTRATPGRVVAGCRRRLARYDRERGSGDDGSQ